tara:strand:+ start:2408 stop:3199 length:792 start_codon:yes stop_codon:yes gene_type:complete
MSDEPNTNLFADEIFSDKITATESIETDQIQSNKVIITGELNAGTLKGDGSQLTGVLNGFTFPSVDGSSGDVLQTNGNKTLSFATPTQWTVHKTYAGSTNHSYFEATDLNNPQVVKLVFHEIRHSLAGRNHMFIGGFNGYEDSGYYDVGYTAKDDGTVTRAKQIDKSNWFPLDYNMTNTNSLYSGEIIINKVTTGSDMLPYYYTYNSHVEAGLAYGGWSGTVDYYELSWKGHNNDLTYPLGRVKLENGNGGSYTGRLTILSQR